MKFLGIFIILMGSFAVKAQTTLIAKKSIADSVVTALKNKRAATDKYLDKHGKALLLYSKLPKKKTPVKVLNDNWPEEGGDSYNVLKDTAGKIIMIAEIPFSESGDWFITYTHYFDANGNTYAFRRQSNTFDDSVKDGVIYETSVKYYDVNFKPVAKIYTLKDKRGRPIKNNGHINIYDYKYSVYKNSAECLKALNLNAF
ncbi:MAG: hypothetical protein WC615_23105 [Mucilaginibacter sp.]|jgi:hypothetical protein|uniref:hypothetical protein n=1 Tax=Mucilaginibacter sp. TaxID=1882438 RepID=UPI003561544C